MNGVEQFLHFWFQPTKFSQRPAGFEIAHDAGTISWVDGVYGCAGGGGFATSPGQGLANVELIGILGEYDGEAKRRKRRGYVQLNGTALYSVRRMRS